MELKSSMKTANRKITWPISFLCISLVFFLTCPALAVQFKVTRVLDGDTIKVSSASGEMTIRLVGIDPPEVSHKKREPGQPFSQQATKHLAGLLLNRTVDIKEYGHDRFGRILGVVSLGGKNINTEMLEAGFAEVYRGDPAPGQDLGPYWKAEGKARATKTGMWVQGLEYVSPREWRRR